MQAVPKTLSELELHVLLPAHGLLPRRVFFWLLVCFTGSGMSRLIYEVAWVRSLELVFGTTTFALATVLAVFMGGLAGGSYAMGRVASRFAQYHPLRLYALLEVLIAGAALALPVLLETLVPLYQTAWQKWHASFAVVSVLPFGLSALVLLVPTILMGATLPVLSGFVSRTALLGEQRIGWLYACNTLGAVLGCAAAGLALFPAIGRSHTVGVAIGLNLLADRRRLWVVAALERMAPETRRVPRTRDRPRRSDD